MVGFPQLLRQLLLERQVVQFDKLLRQFHFPLYHMHQILLPLCPLASQAPSKPPYFFEYIHNFPFYPHRKSYLHIQYPVLLAMAHASTPLGAVGIRVFMNRRFDSSGSHVRPPKIKRYCGTA
eukprot:UN00960